MRPTTPAIPTARCAGQAATDYLMVVALVAVVFSVGEDGPISQVVRAFGDYYQRFSWSMAQP
jgi:hypothetical protein